MITHIKLRKSGNSLIATIPSEIIQFLKLEDEEIVSIDISKYIAIVKNFKCFDCGTKCVFQENEEAYCKRCGSERMEELK